MAVAIVTPELITWARNRVNLTPAEVAKKINVSEDALSAWESGNGHPTFRQAERLLALGAAGAAAQSADGELRQTEHLKIENPKQLDGAKAEKVEFCVPCHATVKDKDYLFYVPEAYR